MLAEAGMEAVMPPKSTRICQADLDALKYKARNVVERFFRRMKEWRRLFGAMDWLRHA